MLRVDATLMIFYFEKKSIALQLEVKQDCLLLNWQKLLMKRQPKIMLKWKHREIKASKTHNSQFSCSANKLHRIQMSFKIVLSDPCNLAWIALATLILSLCFLDSSLPQL